MQSDGAAASVMREPFGISERLRSQPRFNKKGGNAMTANKIVEALLLSINGLLEIDETELGEVAEVLTFDGAGLLTNDEGLVLRMDDGSEFQLTIKKSR